jgi:hypothetical protein
MMQARHARAYAEHHFNIGYIGDRFLQLLQEPNPSTATQLAETYS